MRWFGITSLFGHARNLVASAIAAEQIDSRDWMRPQEPAETLRSVLHVLGGNESAATLAEGIARPLWIDFVADTGDDRDVSLAVARMLFGTYRDQERELPRGDVLLFGGDTAYPVATADEIFARVVAPFNEALREVRQEIAGVTDRRRVLLGIPGNHDWYDGLDGFARMFRSSTAPVRSDDVELPKTRTRGSARIRAGRSAGIVARQLHLDEVGGFFGILVNGWRSVRALWKGAPLKRRKRLALLGYEAVQESTFFALPLAPGLDVYAVDRQLGRIDYRQRVFFRALRKGSPDQRILFVAPDPAVAFGEPWDPGVRMLGACHLDLEDDKVLYLTGDMHHYERRAFGRSLHVIAGGGGAFLHGTRIRVGPGGKAACAYPSGAECRRLVAQVPLKLMAGSAGFLVHLMFAALASLELAASLRGTVSLVVTAVLVSMGLVVVFYVNAGHHRAHPRSVAAVAVPFGAGLGLLPMALRLALPQIVPHLGGFALPELAGDGAVIVLYAFLGALGFGLFLMTIAIVGLEHQQAFSVLAHPGFKHFVRMCVHPDGRIEAWTIGKDDPVAPGAPVLIDRFEW